VDSRSISSTKGCHVQGHSEDLTVSADGIVHCARRQISLISREAARSDVDDDDRPSLAYERPMRVRQEENIDWKIGECVKRSVGIHVAAQLVARVAMDHEGAPVAKHFESSGWPAPQLRQMGRQERPPRLGKSIDAIPVDIQRKRADEHRIVIALDTDTRGSVKGLEDSVTVRKVSDRVTEKPDTLDGC
jgi:hypothetical protein